jgi:aminoglycoside 6'-N-acetyltransferase I
MEILVREMQASDRAAWTQMRATLWPEDTEAAHGEMIEAMLRSEDAWGFMAEIDGAPAGFAELAIRDYANGCDIAPVPFLEGIWVSASRRRLGIGARLIAHIEAFVRSRGFCEIGSDAPIDNCASQAAHRSWGFSETERVVYFRKRLQA